MSDIAGPAGTTGKPPTRSPRSPWRWIAGILIVVMATLAALAAVVWFSFDQLGSLLPFGETGTVDRSQGAVLLTLSDLSEFTAASGRFQVIIDIERDVPVVPRQIAGERVLFVAQGSVDAAVDFSELGPGTVRIDDARERVVLDLPHAELTEAQVDPEASYVFARERGILDRIGGVFSDNPTSERELYLTAEEKLATAAEESDLVEQAERNTTAMLQGLLGSLGFHDITVNYGR
jgi:hypothetical protein